MPTVTSHQPGSFCWIELATNDAAAALQFYTQLFSWSVNEVPMGEMGTYYICQNGGRDAAAMYQSDQPGTPPNWQSYVAVANVDASTEQAKSLGATVVAGPFDVFESGRMSVIADPQGAVFAMWQPKTHAGVQVRDEANAICWNELQARDTDAAKAFYGALFHWRMKEAAEYTEWHLGEHAVGGMLQSQWPPEAPSLWLAYFAVGDADAAIAQAQSLGGKVIVPAMDIPNVGRFAVLSDPQGAVFAVIQLLM